MKDLPLAAASERLRKKPGRPRNPRPEPEPEAVAAMSRAVARLLDLDGAAIYLSVSSWTVRDLEAAGILRRIRIPLPGGGELRKVLFDVRDLDRLIESWKEAAP